MVLKESASSRISGDLVELGQASAVGCDVNRSRCVCEIQLEELSACRRDGANRCPGGRRDEGAGLNRTLYNGSMAVADGSRTL